jgi:hypothetical protein
VPPFEPQDPKGKENQENQAGHQEARIVSLFLHLLCPATAVGEVLLLCSILADNSQQTNAMTSNTQGLIGLPWSLSLQPVWLLLTSQSDHISFKTMGEYFAPWSFIDRLESAFRDGSFPKFLQGWNSLAPEMGRLGFRLWWVGCPVQLFLLEQSRYIL